MITHARSLLTAAALVVFALAVTSCEAEVYVKWDSPGPVFDGNSWETAYHTIQAGIDDADAADEEVWVAQGSYNERVTLKNGVVLKGGFLGSGDIRDPSTYVTIIDGGTSGDVITAS